MIQRIHESVMEREIIDRFISEREYPKSGISHIIQENRFYDKGKQSDTMEKQENFWLRSRMLDSFFRTQKALGFALFLGVFGFSLWFFWLGRARPVAVVSSPIAPQSDVAKPDEIPAEVTPIANESPQPTPVMEDSSADAVQAATVTPASQPTPKQKASTPAPAKSSTTTSKGTDASMAKARWVKFGFSVGSEDRSIDTVVIHSTYNAIGGDEFDTDQVIEEYRQASVSPHYVVARDGAVYQLVHERDIAWHAGVSKMKDGRTNVNDFSVGIEMIGTKTSGYTDAQYAALKKLLGNIKSRHTIKNVVGHDDIAPGRKTDPWQFEWSRIR